MTGEAFVAFGANCGDPAEMHRRVRDALSECAEVSAVRASRLVASVPVGDATARYLNGVFAVASAVSPRALFEALGGIERRFGRTEKGNWAPRTVDLDLVLWGEHVVAEPDLLLPHPRMHFRRFVLAPLAELDPRAAHPLLGLSVADLLGRLDETRVAAAGGTPAWPGRSVAWTGPALRHGGQVIGGTFAGAAPLVALCGAPPDGAESPAGPWTPVVDCRGDHPAAMAKQLEYLRQSLAPVEPA